MPQAYAYKDAFMDADHRQLTQVPSAGRACVSCAPAEIPKSKVRVSHQTSRRHGGGFGSEMGLSWEVWLFIACSRRPGSHYGRS